MSDERTLDLLETKIEELKQLNAMDGIDLSGEITKLEKKLVELRRKLYSNLSDWERVKIARNPKRPYALDYIKLMFDGFYEIHGDRMIGDDRALLTGLAQLDGRTVMLVAQQKGRTTEENKERYFGMTRPQGYRKAVRAMKLAERFSFPVVTLIDTPGAYPGVESEASNIGGAIAESLLAMSQLRTPIVSVVIGEGGSGGALAIGLADRVLMLENAVYSVITPEGAAAILWKEKDRSQEAAAALQLTAEHLLQLGLIDGVIPEPLGGAHKDFAMTVAALKPSVVGLLDELRSLGIDELLDARFRRYRAVGSFRELGTSHEASSSDEKVSSENEADAAIISNDSPDA
ncbi:acetyl-CoA carboxylase carboxyltransferase subunit alpha [Candidatus Bipolaricaulota bacterium]|nr:acetyl-CoA carboxylase carboxyltransferase subunit alpha [Candidatus Bipolaricaulota bacterium]TFH11829.1 MAG: acetyl-CoA carboxylase carboxyltransferase subunit alpha [Candidatus Atribacteria bacterium]